MEPRKCPLRPARSHTTRLASMRPGRWSPGNEALYEGYLAARKALQLGRGDRAPEMRCKSAYSVAGWCCFNEAGAMEPRKCRTSRPESPNPPGFNEAGAMEPRKCVVEGDGTLTVTGLQ